MFEGWGEFFILIGGASGALIGLLFVVTVLAADMRYGTETLSQGAAMYMTPTLLHFVTVLVMSTVGIVPHVESRVFALVLAAWSLVAAIYSGAMAVLVRTRRLPDSGHWTDVWTYGILPALMYVALIACAWSTWRQNPNAPYAIAIGLVVLTIIGIRNAWDLVTFIAPRSASGAKEQ
jgi:hypothetical protein